MVRFGKNFSKDNRGEIMLESSIILVAVLILLIALLSMCFMFYQQAAMTSIASELSSTIAKNYKYPGVALNTDAFTEDEVTAQKKYRLTLTSNKLEELFDGKAESRAMERLRLSSLGFNVDDVEADCEIVISGVGRAFVKVTVTNKTRFLFSGLLEALNIYDGAGFSAVSYAEITDMTGYASMVNFSRYIAKVLEPLGKIGDIYTTFGDIIDILKG